MLARHWPTAPHWLLINGNDLADPRIAAFRVAACNNGSLAREKVKIDILVPSDYIFFFLLITFGFWPFSLSQTF